MKIVDKILKKDQTKKSKVSKVKDGPKIADSKQLSTDVKSKNKKNTGDAYRILIKPLISEKGSLLASYNQYLFEVAVNSNKIEIKKVIKDLYGVDAIRVRIVNRAGKATRYGRTSGTTKRRKKAIVCLKPGDKIDVYEGV